MHHAVTSQMSIAEINSRIDQLRGEILAYYGISWTVNERSSEGWRGGESAESQSDPAPGLC